MKTIIKVLCVLVMSAFVFACDKEDTNPIDDPNPAPGETLALSITSVSPSSATVGTKVVITGTGFSTSISANAVKFGLISSAIDSATSTRIVTTVPKDAITSKISVMVGSKTVNNSSDFTVIQEPASFGAVSKQNVPSEISPSQVTLSSEIEKEGSKTIVQHGHAWGTDPSDFTAKGRVKGAAGKTELGKVPENAVFPYKFSSMMKDLDGSTEYYVRSYVTTSEGTVYGDITKVKTSRPCVVSGVSTESTQIYRDSKDRITAVNHQGGRHTIAYDTEGYPAKYELSNSAIGLTFSETYAYKEGRIEKIQFTSAALGNRSTVYEYDNEGNLKKETIVTSSETLVYLYEKWVLKSVSGSGTTQYTVKDGQVVKVERSPGNYTDSEYDARGNIRKMASYTNGELSTTLEYVYDDKPNWGLYLLNVKGWHVSQLLKSRMMSMLSHGTTYNNYTEYKYKSKTSNALTTRTYTYNGSRVNSVETKQFNNGQPDYTDSYTIYYAGDCK